MKQEQEQLRLRCDHHEEKSEMEQNAQVRMVRRRHKEKKQDKEAAWLE